MPSQKQLNEQLLNAAQRGQLDFVEQAIQDEVDVNAKGNSGETALSYAALNYHLEVV